MYGKEQYQDILISSLLELTNDTELMDKIEFAIDFSEFRSSKNIGLTYQGINKKHVTLEPKMLKGYTSLTKLFFFQLIAFHNDLFTHSFILDNFKSILQIPFVDNPREEEINISTEHALAVVKRNIKYIKNLYLPLFEDDSLKSDKFFEKQGSINKKDIHRKFNERVYNLEKFYESFDPVLIDTENKLDSMIIFRRSAFENTDSKEEKYTSAIR